MKITEEIATEKGRSNEPKQQKKNSSPGLLKKSLESDKRMEQRMSPPTHQAIETITKIDKSQDFTNGLGTPQQPLPRKGYSPTNNVKKITQLFSNASKLDIFQQPPKLKETTKVTKTSNLDRSPEGEKKQNQSPRAGVKANPDLKVFLINSLKNF
jgi:hypothetical protein